MSSGADAVRRLKHDLRTPVNHILGYSELALEAALDDRCDTAVFHFRRVVEAANTLSREVNDALASAALSAATSRVAGAAAAFVAVLDADANSAELSAYAQDLAKVRAAAERLLASAK